MASATPAKQSKTDASEKLAEGYRYVTVPAEDIYENKFEGVWLNNRHFAPGTHLVAPDIATTLEDRLKVWQASMIRLMRPGNDKATKATMAKQGLHLVEGELLNEAKV